MIVYIPRNAQIYRLFVRARMSAAWPNLFPDLLETRDVIRAAKQRGRNQRRGSEKSTKEREPRRPPLLDRQFVTRQGSYQALSRRGCTCRHVVKAGPKDKRVALSRRINYQFLPERFLTFASAGRGKRYRRERWATLPLSLLIPSRFN